MENKSLFKLIALVLILCTLLFVYLAYDNQQKKLYSVAWGGGASFFTYKEYCEFTNKLGISGFNIGGPNERIRAKQQKYFYSWIILSIVSFFIAISLFSKSNK